MTAPLVVIPCGAAKQPAAAMACNLYVGPVFRAAWRWARSVAAPSDIRILSAKHGLVEPTRMLHPYNIKMGQPGSVAAATVAAQLPPGRNVVAVGGVNYRRMLTEACHIAGVAVMFPFPPLPMGYMIQALNRAHGTIPSREAA